ncbi:MAG: type II toxin-antitoxin system RelE/ParE family toxin [Archaeoglobus sp.]|uniref:type II toxin-antitoxin system RelE family toxin n=1 Tax=Archaeoglobus sp. TaxID=1872626 RepID=UPI001DD4BE20|nr:type II toxin-antitoxin system RelE/ParE family toxin [Archaeoglobus sp.]MBO8180834.1 type II toxin-antitoxin system RelE/ParE family toxin [Archaeoglobus sp.]
MFKVKLHRRVIKFLQKLNETDRKRIFLAIEKLEDPFSQPYEKVKGRKDLYKIRVGDYRIIYRVDKENKIVSVHLVDKRERVYDRL